ncbi:protein-L-isoaspartate(D-aspartate) O-methyltransferase [Xanthovirga aplysinae]|uniref:protein-L-isoaspartate(D-aspartate) O-methyltransferase n=1 Tax=Xanthovirga aplysinae TaxID=2529853 RepID=UPI0012BC7BA9|nr:protein-L-isoaspartate(D-aspartate) O-methyltransferase [Xanthovirga aplysinae]MTI32323.1 protein-L-isoaspartate(D-aspartate) O-methyltransferase [Xanthovirga aplysinae]
MLEDSYKHKGMRNALVKEISSKGIKDERVLAAFLTVPRHYFFEKAFLEHAYQDKAFPIGEGQTISQPYTVAIMTELLKVQEGDKVLEIGTGSGYQACILEAMGAEVYTIEYNKVLYERALHFLPKIGYNPTILCGDGSEGVPQYAPYDKIIVTAGAPTVPSALIDQLKVGGVLIIPVGNRLSQKMIRIIKETETKLIKEEHHNFCFVPLLGKSGWK